MHRFIRVPKRWHNTSVLLRWTCQLIDNMIRMRNRIFNRELRVRYFKAYDESKSDFKYNWIVQCFTSRTLRELLLLRKIWFYVTFVIRIFQRKVLSSPDLWNISCCKMLTRCQSKDPSVSWERNELISMTWKISLFELFFILKIIREQYWNSLTIDLVYTIWWMNFVYDQEKRFSTWSKRWSHWFLHQLKKDVDGFVISCISSSWTWNYSEKIWYAKRKHMYILSFPIVRFYIQSYLNADEKWLIYLTEIL